MMAIGRILVPTDFSEPAAAALQYAHGLAAVFASRLHLFHVLPEPYAYPWGTDLATFPLTELMIQSEAAARERLEQVAGSLSQLPGGVEISTAPGAPVDRILDYVKDQAIDLVVMGTHGRGTVGHLLLGSVAERVIRHSTVPVLTVHGTRAAAGADAQRPDTSG